MTSSSSFEQRSCCVCLAESRSSIKDIRGTNICGGCAKRFCNGHYKNHRADIDKQFQHLGEEHDLLAEQLNHITSIDPMTLPLMEEINRWEVETIDQVRLAATSARQNIVKLLQQDNDVIKNQFKTFTNELKEKESKSEYDEIDIEEIKAKLSELKQQIGNLSDETIKIEYQKIEWDTLILTYKIINCPTLDKPLMQSQLHQDDTKQYFSDTTLLTSEQEMILNEFYGTPNQQWKLLYKATRDGFKPKDFHRCCDKRGPTMTIYRDDTSRYLFGGFTSISWTSPYLLDAAPRDSSAFLFTLKNPHSLAPTKFPLRNSRLAGVFHHKDYGPSFGFADDFSDIYYTQTEQCYVYFPRSYVDITQSNYTYKMFTGTNRFSLSDIEVFTLL
ncbi:hypothetical protein I4U23_004717 [Adineta vaga]|nr:hypothetical protein I4U23_004717 [Adineta vaga]